MAYYDTCWYCNAGDQSTTGYYAVAKWAATTAIAAGALRRQLATPTVGSERVFVCVVAGTTGGTEPTWVATRGAKTTDGTVTWMECTGIAALNSDLVNCPTWTAVKNQSVSLGQVIQRNSGASLQICTTAGTTGNGAEPSFSNTAGTTTTDNSVTWTSLGVVGNFTGGGAPFARLTTVVNTAWLSQPSFSYTIYVGDNHAETQASSLSILFNANQVVSVSVLCFNHSGSYPPTAFTTGATITTSGNTTLTLQVASFYIYGLTFMASATGVSSTSYLFCKPNSSWLYCDNCSFQIANTVVNASMIVGDTTLSGAGSVTWNNCTVKLGAVSQSVQICNVGFLWKNTGAVLVSGSSVPSSFFGSGINGGLSDTILEGIDLSQITTNLCTNWAMGQMLVKDCKLNAAMAVLPPGVSGPEMVVQFVRSDSGAIAYKSTRYLLQGTETTETSITRVGGASDPTGQAQSRKIVTTGYSLWLKPFKAEPYAIWNTVTGATVTVTIYGTINAGALPNNDDIWMEVEYLGSAASTLGTIISTTKSNLLASNAAVASDSSTWNGGGSGAGWSPFKLTTTLSSPQPGQAGLIYVRPSIAKPSATFYLDPNPVLS